ncbi:hypothetical protein FC682_21825 [Peribacillus simplex]|uniref:Uncharacterized protein n=1 Tax=Peribacillus simplex TaxID=1478 RepID=A0A9X9ER46_9BACI|nr:hypothetical protein FC682_21825 [Peribacillus simplex]TKH08185.1 hypothetical protein FC678_21060 [Peribacillus simplex]
MEISGYILAAILGATIVIFIHRIVPLMLLSKMQIQNRGIKGLKHAPVASSVIGSRTSIIGTGLFN